MKPVSISVRLTAWYAGVSALGFITFGVVMWFVLARSMISWKDRTLQMRASRVEQVLNGSSTGNVKALNHRLEDVVEVLPEGEWIHIVKADGRVLYPSNVPPAVSGIQSACKTALYRDHVVQRERFRELCHPVTYAGEQAFLLVPSPLSEDRILLRIFTLGLYRMVPILLLVASTGGYLLSRRALAPVDIVIAEAKAITADDLSKRLTLSAADDQLRRLGVEWNSLLSRIEKAMIRISQFTADASHELRSPVAFIRATAEYHLGDPDLTEDLKDTFRAIVDESCMITDLLENLLLLAGTEAVESGSPQMVPVDVDALVTELALRFAPGLSAQHQQLHIQTPDPPLPMLRMNAGHLRRVLTTVLENASKYTPKAGCIHVTYAVQHSLQISIADTGIGIAAEHLDRIFDRFFRVDQVRTGMKEGVGLGLPIAKQLMEQYHGTISVVSQLQKGTCVTLTFPAALLHGSVSAMQLER